MRDTDEDEFGEVPIGELVISGLLLWAAIGAIAWCFVGLN